MNELLQIARNGVKVNVAIDVQSAVIAAFAIFMALTLALLVYGKLIR